MEYISEIQSIVDEHKAEMPTGVVTRVMEECQRAYEATPELYKLTWTTVGSKAHSGDGERHPGRSHPAAVRFRWLVRELPKC